MAWTNLFEIFLLLVIPFSLPRMFGPDGRRHPPGLRVVAVMGVLWLGAVVIAPWAELRRRGHGDRGGRCGDGGQGGPLRGPPPRRCSPCPRRGPPPAR